MADVALAIEGVGRRGEGVARTGGRTVFVPYTLPDEEVTAEGAGERLSLTAVVTASPDRVAPFCRHYGRCGGCQLQHWREQPYRSWKASLVSGALKARSFEAAVADCIDAHGAGRRRVALHVRKRNGVVTAGYMAARSHTLLDIGHCPVLEPALERAFDIARALGATLGDCDVGVTATRAGPDVSVKAGRDVLAREHGSLASFVNALKLARLSVNGEVIASAAAPRVQLGKATVALPPGGFLQATAQGEETLARLVVDALGKARNAADLFCGIGPFAFRIAERARVAAYDNDRPAIAALNAAIKATSGLKPMTAAVRDLFREPLAPGEMEGLDAVVFDPPRAGAEAQARQLARSKVKTAVAVSCDPVTFARDAEILIGGGFSLKQVTAVDQFKYSSHVEVVARFTR
ncbi:class I SAM-dependent RNA methyltransferase [Aestuariivirga sp.]|uniref:class I SAM-dependent RNA methyltransferase n=1 Tax=Aestuariivirga sp. TaxID=2650926 RepID=UPI0025C398F2|nr:TRAM domain-containing protein [Aestuariivirga sp.]MCA3556261.1 class I SAM-dependent RNA methyltransferase [Aestuariivirga sp.]